MNREVQSTTGKQGSGVKRLSRYFSVTKGHTGLKRTTFLFSILKVRKMYSLTSTRRVTFQQSCPYYNTRYGIQKFSGETYNIEGKTGVRVYKIQKNCLW